MNDGISTLEGECPGQIYHAGIVSIDPNRVTTLAGYSRNARSCPPGTYGLEANWLTLDTSRGIIVILSIDALFSSTAFEQVLGGALKAEAVPVTGILVLASHTHFAPQLDPTKPDLGAADVQHIEDIAERIARDIASIHRTQGRQATQLRYGASAVSESVYRRRRGLRVHNRFPFMKRAIQMAPNPSINIPRDLRLWFPMGPDNDYGAAIFTWPCHPVSRAEKNRPSSDYIGVVRARLRERMGHNLPIIFAPGCCGDIRPDFPAPWLARRTLLPFPLQRGFSPAKSTRVRTFDRKLESAADEALDSAKTLNFVPSASFEKNAVNLSTIAQGASGDLPIFLVNIFGLRILGLGAEPSAGWQERMDPDAESALVTGYAGSVFGYLPTPDQISEGGYEVNGFRSAFGFTGRYHENLPMEQNILASVGELLARHSKAD